MDYSGSNQQGILGQLSDFDETWCLDLRFNYCTGKTDQLIKPRWQIATNYT